MEKNRTVRRNGNALVLAAVVVPWLVAAGEAVKKEGPPQETKQDKLLQLLGGISRNMELIEELLQKKDSGPACQNKQKTLTEQLDVLIEELQKRQQSCGQGGGQGQQQQQQESQEDQKASKNRQDVGKQEGRKPKTGPAKKVGEKESPGKVPNVRRARENPPEPGSADPLTEKRGAGGWGFLPGEVRAQAEAEGRTGIPAKYAEMIRRYFERLSEPSEAE
jgi:hypothetical protein